MLSRIFIAAMVLSACSAASAFAAWTSPLLISPASTYEASVPHIAPGFGGKVYVVWQQKDWYLRFRERSAAGAWSAISVLNTAFSAGAVVVEDSQGRPNIVFMERSVTATIDLVHLYRNTSGTWVRTVITSTTDYDEDWPLLDTDASGKLHVVYTKVVPGAGGGNIYYRRYSNGVWSGETSIGTTDSVGYRGPDMQTDSAGVVHVCWMTVSGGQYVTQYRRYNGSSWTTTATIGQSVSTLFTYSPRIAVADSSTIVATWTRSTCSGGCYVTDYTASTNGGTTWSTVQNRSVIYTGNMYGRAGKAYFVGHDADRTRVMLFTWSNGAWNAGVRVNAGELYWTGWADVTQTVEGSLHVVYDDVTDGTMHQIGYVMQASTSLNGTVTGRVVDSVGPVPYVTVTSSLGGQTASAYDGTFSLLCPAGTGTVRATMLGYNDTDVPNVVVTAGQTTAVGDIMLTGLPPMSPDTNLTLTPGNGTIALNWQNSPSVNFSGTLIVYRTDRYPTSATDGTAAVDKTGVAGAADNYMHTDLTNGTTVYYALFAHDNHPVRTYASAITGSAIPALRIDRDSDGDVDQSDFGWFQACLTGAFVPQYDSACGDALLDNDNDVDEDDVTIFQGCFSGAGVVAPPSCLP